VLDWALSYRPLGTVAVKTERRPCVVNSSEVLGLVCCGEDAIDCCLLVEMTVKKSMPVK
jgi:hypothetical protein